MSQQNTKSSKTANPRACPVCRDANNVDFSELNQDSDDRVYIDCKCNNCGATWRSWYSLIFDGSSIGFAFDKNSDTEKGEQNGRQTSN